ncbi:MAG: hypothetical protein U0527_11845 [Candidatus Eisenbacteria bacterium]
MRDRTDSASTDRGEVVGEEELPVGVERLLLVAEAILRQLHHPLRVVACTHAGAIGVEQREDQDVVGDDLAHHLCQVDEDLPHIERLGDARQHGLESYSSFVPATLVAGPEAIAFDRGREELRERLQQASHRRRQLRARVRGQEQEADARVRRPERRAVEVARAEIEETPFARGV